MASFHVTPIAPDLCHERIDIYLIGEAADAPQYETQRQAVLEMWRDLNKEDIGLIESLLTLNIIDEITETRGRSNKECVAQGIANVLSGFFSGMGGCAMLGQSLINISSGARARLSGIVAAIMLLVFIMYFYELYAKRNLIGTARC